MDDAELFGEEESSVFFCVIFDFVGKIIKVKQAKPYRNKGGMNRAIWDEEDWHKKNLETYEKTGDGKMDSENK
jgi:hypothetical protein